MSLGDENTTQQIVPEEFHERQTQQNDLPCFQTGTAWDYWQGYLLYKGLFETAYHDEAYDDIEIFIAQSKTIYPLTDHG